jgi:hypothetical protein
MPDDLREALDAAVEKVESETPVPVEAAAPPPPAPPPSEEPKSPAPAEAPATPTEVPETAVPLASEAKAPVDHAPKSWKSNVAPKWATLDPEVKAEINRREKEITKSFGENNQVREFSRQFQEVIRPYEAHLMSYGKPLEAIANLLQVEHALSSFPPVQRAHLMAKLIKDYGVDIKELDSALAGTGPTDPTRSALEQLLEQKLSPIQNFIQQQQELDLMRQQRTRNDAVIEIERMSEDTVTFPHFEEVREDMADLVEMNAKRGRYLTPGQAYNMAVGMNPAWAAEGPVTLPVNAQQQQLSASDARAQKALQASASIKSLPSSTPTHVNNAETLRGAIESAFEHVSGR